MSTQNTEKTETKTQAPILSAQKQQAYQYLSQAVARIHATAQEHAQFQGALKVLIAPEAVIKKTEFEIKQEEKQNQIKKDQLKVQESFNKKAKGK